MEESHKHQLQAKIKEVEDLLYQMNMDYLSKAKDKAQKEIEDHFNNLFKALQERKDQLMTAVDNEFKQYAHTMKDQVSINIILKNASEQIHQSLSSMELSGQHSDGKKMTKECKIDLPDNLLKEIQNYGQIYMNDKEVILCKPSVVTTVAGSTQGSVDGRGPLAKMTNPFGIILNTNDDNLYFCDYGNKMVRKLTKSGEVTKYATVLQPSGIAWYQKENCYYVLDCASHSIKRVSGNTGEVRTFAGCGQGYQDGEGGNAKFNYPYGIAVNQQTGDLFVGDYSNNVIRKITHQGFVSTLSGAQGKKGYQDGPADTALFICPVGVCFSPLLQSLLVCDYGNNKLRKVSLDGDATTICEIPGPRFACELPNGNIFVSSSQQKIFKISFGGTGKQGEKDGIPQDSEFNYPNGMALDLKLNCCFVADFGNHKIRSIQFE